MMSLMANLFSIPTLDLQIFLQNAVPKSVIVLHGVEWPFLTLRHDKQFIPMELKQKDFKIKALFEPLKEVFSFVKFNWPFASSKKLFVILSMLLLKLAEIVICYRGLSKT